MLKNSEKFEMINFLFMWPFITGENFGNFPMKHDEKYLNNFHTIRMEKCIQIKYRVHELRCGHKHTQFYFSRVYFWIEFPLL